MGLHTSWAKTKVQNTASGPPPTMCTIFGHQVQAVTKFTYLSSGIDSSGYCAPDIHRRLGLASSIMSQLDRVWKQSHLSNSTKFRIYTTVPVSCRYLCMDLKHGQCSSQMSQSFKHYICKIKGAFLASTGSTSSKNEEVSRISGLPPIDVVTSQRRHSLFGHVRRMDSRATPCCQHTVWLEARQQLEKTTRTSAQFLGQADHHQQHHLT